MFGFLKNIFGNKADDSLTISVVAPAIQALPTKPTSTGTQFTHKPTLTPANGNGNGHTNGNEKPHPNEVQLLLQPILDGLPVELRRKALHADLGRTLVNLPIEKILPQLSRGMVKITFGELRAAAPGIFVAQTDRDTVEIILPLAQILNQISPALLSRRPAQNQVQIPEEVNSPFGGNGDGLIFAVGQGKVEPLVPPQRSIKPTPSAPIQTSIPNRNQFMSVNPPTPPAAARIPVPPTPAELPALRMAAPQLPAAPTPPPKPIASTPLNAPGIPHAPISFNAVVPVVTEAKPAATDGEVLLVPLASLASGWPETVRGDIVRLNLMSAKLALPANSIEPALKRGRIPFKWGVLRSWAKPAPMLNMSPHDDVVVELPLEVIAPLFFERQRNLVPKRVKVAIDETIPDLFFGFPQPESLSAPDSHAVSRPSDTNLIGKFPTDEPSAPPLNGIADADVSDSESKSSDTNYYVWNDSTDTARLDKIDTIPAKLDTAFIKRSSTPKEIVTRAVALEHVAGALIALPDGLLVASQIPPDLNGDTLAGFIPQIFNKVNQASNELRMGELNNLAFTVGNVPWKIFRVNAVFFAAFGRASEQMPTAQLAALAAELDQKNR